MTERPRRVDAAPKGSRLSREELVSLFGKRLDPSKIDEAVVAAAARLGYGATHYDRDQALAILEELAGASGVLSVAARFTKARFLLVSDHGVK